VQETFNEIIAKSQDWGAQFKSTITGALNDVNGAILHILTTKPQAGEQPFREAGKQVFTSIAKTGLESAEGSIMKALGFGTKVQHVHVDNMPDSGPLGGVGKGGIMGMLNDSNWASSLFGGKLFGSGSFFGGSATSTTSAASSPSSALGKILGMALPFVGMMAEGGIMSPGDFYLTGEQGPELMQVGSTSRINSARDTSKIMSGGGDTTHQWNIDARGATDPAAVRMQVMQGIKQAVPHIVALSHATSKEATNRAPRMK